MKKPFRILLLAGTGEARQLAGQLSTIDGLVVIASLAGATRQPKPYPIDTRTGGFGGADGLARYIDEKRINLVINATHPFAETMTANAIQAASRCGVALLRLVRQPWRPLDGDRWQDVGSVAEAVAALPDNARVLFATGRGSVEQIARAETGTGFWGAIRLIDPPDQPFPLASGEFIVAPPPFSVEQELELMDRLHITDLVTKNAGGNTGLAKLEAARRRGIGVVAIAPPEQPAGQITVPTRSDLMARVFDAMSQSRPDKA